MDCQREVQGAHPSKAADAGSHTRRAFATGTLMLKPLIIATHRTASIPPICLAVCFTGKSRTYLQTATSKLQRNVKVVGSGGSGGLVLAN